MTQHIGFTLSYSGANTTSGMLTNINQHCLLLRALAQVTLKPAFIRSVIKNGAMAIHPFQSLML